MRGDCTARETIFCALRPAYVLHHDIVLLDSDSFEFWKHALEEGVNNGFVPSGVDDCDAEDLCKPFSRRVFHLVERERWAAS